MTSATAKANDQDGGGATPVPWHAEAFPEPFDILWSTGTHHYRLEPETYDRGGDHRRDPWWAVEVVDLFDAVPGDFQLRILDQTGHPLSGWYSRSGNRLVLPAPQSPVYAEVRSVSSENDGGNEARAYRLRVIRGGSLEAGGRNGEPVDEWEEGGSATGGGSADQNDAGEPVDEWEEGGGTAIALRDGEPVDEWEEGGSATGGGSADQNDAGEPVDEWEEGGRAASLPRLCPDSRHDADDSLACATPISLGGRHSARLGGPTVPRGLEDRDAFVFTLDQRALVVLESRSVIADGGVLDLRGRLFDAWGRLVASGDDGAQGGDFSLAVELPAGAYVLRIESVSGEGGYQLLSARIAPDWDPRP